MNTESLPVLCQWPVWVMNRVFISILFCQMGLFIGTSKESVSPQMKNWVLSYLGALFMLGLEFCGGCVAIEAIWDR